MRILLTGSGGFIGSYLKNLLCIKHTVFSPRSYELNLLDADATRHYVEENCIELILHCAFLGVRIRADDDWDKVGAANVEMFRNLACLVSEKRRMITLGSGAEYDKSLPIVNVSEEDFGRSVPKDPYGFSKYSISKAIEEDYDHILNLRVWGVYGSGEDPSRVTSSMIADYIHCRPIVIRQNVRFSFIYIEDLCRIVDHFVENPTREKFINVAHPCSVEILSLAEIINTFGSWKSEIVVLKDGLNKEYTCNTNRLHSCFPFQFTSYKSGLYKMIRLKI